MEAFVVGYYRVSFHPTDDSRLIVQTISAVSVTSLVCHFLTWVFLPVKTKYTFDLRCWEILNKSRRIINEPLEGGPFLLSISTTLIGQSPKSDIDNWHLPRLMVEDHLWRLSSGDQFPGGQQWEMKALVCPRLTF